jgi:hypothetical protein
MPPEWLTNCRFEYARRVEIVDICRMTSDLLTENAAFHKVAWWPVKVALNESTDAAAKHDAAVVPDQEFSD